MARLRKVTSVLSLATPAFAVHVADRQLSLAGASWDRAANKTVVFGASDAVVVIGYTGVAFVRGKPTDHWIVEKLLGHEVEAAALSLGTAQAIDVGQALRRLEHALNNEVAQSWKRAGTAVVACGFQWHRRDPSRVLQTRRPVLYSAEIERGGDTFVSALLVIGGGHGR